MARPLPEFQIYRPFTIRVAVRGSLAALAKLLDRGSGEFEQGSMLGLLLVHEDLPGLPKYEIRPGGVMVFEAHLTDQDTAEEAYKRLLAELAPLGFEAE